MIDTSFGIAGAATERSLRKDEFIRPQIPNLNDTWLPPEGSPKAKIYILWNSFYFEPENFWGDRALRGGDEGRFRGLLPTASQLCDQLSALFEIY